ncbi:MAG TPA: phenylalanine 4-monooxygenase, partial [Thermoanaerobaculia bacterium]|nr:phenylalanine 4-monooxygenase [Thermoanaerobaculia bacterium]
IVQLAADHPGFNDPEYRRRRNEIAQVALKYHGGPVPRVDYTEEEQGVWREVRERLEPLHARYACREYLEAFSRIGLSRTEIPQLADVNAVLEPFHGFRMLPVAGLVSSKTFLGYLGRSAFLSTQYMRHHSVPLYTPEPDVIHELVGHAATFAHPDFTRLNKAFGQAIPRAVDDEAVERIARLYWYTMEFGVTEEAGKLKVFGAGLLSSFGELGRFETEETLRPFDVEEVVETPYDPTQYQAVLFKSSSFEAMASDVTAWLERF